MPGAVEKNVTVLIVSHNTVEATRRCVAALRRFYPALAIVLVDNASTDGTAETMRTLFPEITLIENRRNRFFTGGINDGLRRVAGKYVLLINSDVFLHDRALDALYAALESDPNAAAATGMQFAARGGGYNFGPSRLPTVESELARFSFFGKRARRRLDEYYYRRCDRDGTLAVDVGCDSFLLIRTDFFRRIGAEDERLLLFYTEEDLAQRIRAAGRKILFVGTSRVVHEWHSSLDRKGRAFVDAALLRDRFVYFRKHAGWFSALLVSLLCLPGTDFGRLCAIVRRFLKFPPDARGRPWKG